MSLLAATTAPATALRSLQWSEARHRTDELFGLLAPGTLYERPVAERHRLIFYLGHVEAFDWNLLSAHALELPAIAPELNKLFAFGIDPEPGRGPQDRPEDWPAVQHVLAYRDQVRQTLDQYLDVIPSDLFEVAREHRLMHAETLAYLFHHLSGEQKRGALPVASAFVAPPPREVEVPAGYATLGQPRDGAFGWDNEFEESRVRVPRFAIDERKVSNGDYLLYVREGGPVPPFWREQNGEYWLRCMFGEVPLPPSWPVWVTQQQAAAYAAWRGRELPTEAQFHRAAYGTAFGGERMLPWGDAPPEPRHGNFNFREWDPVPVTADPDGASGFGVAQLSGNGWEWTSSVFAPLPGFAPFPFYPGYSADFFDGQHYVLKGASPRTAAVFLRRSFRNWFRADYPYVFAGFRCVNNDPLAHIPAL